MKYYFSIIILIFSFQAFSQSLTTRDFKLALDGFSAAHPDSVIFLTKDQLLGVKKIHANFSWAQIRSFSVYFSSSVGTPCTNVSSCKGDAICPELLPYFKRSGSGTVISFAAVVFNRQNVQVEWPVLTIIVK